MNKLNMPSSEILHMPEADHNLCHCTLCKERRRQVAELILSDAPLGRVRRTLNTLAFVLYIAVASGAIGTLLYAGIWGIGGINYE